LTDNQLIDTTGAAQFDLSSQEVRILAASDLEPLRHPNLFPDLRSHRC